MARGDFESAVAHYYHRLDLALEEDIPALVNQHLRLASSLAKQGRSCPDVEANVASFAFWYARRMR